MTAYEEMSSLVNYIQPTKFISFEFSARMFVSIGWLGREGRLGSGTGCPGSRMSSEWGERKGPVASWTKGLVYKYPA